MSCLPQGFQTGTSWSEVGSANYLATQTLLFQRVDMGPNCLLSNVCQYVFIDYGQKYENIISFWSKKASISEGMYNYILLELT